ncbi:hypothetical protein CB0940_11447 [Cercospora beticola]|uniref:Uncharacterized protein n=1 Tax=Cercospora beticola TaxID=122368 RepID=A0A2G5HCY9_CERBT|nr:hypothetical protein CB0940_11447 [Cercospora beticola]PIA90365.1 hypothetical protein CB0940_11447 [Cercospora beticola]WPB08302.1 hypothetical protein RHO25_012968 [Cercospora beticola]CAK1367815.1 unnamed protein product [Cercospora beticola]
MPTTRSQSNGTAKTGKDASPNAITGTKRKASTTKSTPAKKAKNAPTKQTKIEPESGNLDTKVEDDAEDETVIINRAPVLELWGACITQTLHPSLAWSTCLSVGSAISTLAAISKGRSIGKIDKPDSTEQAAKQQKRKKEQVELEEVDVMSFHLKLKDGSAVVGDQPKKANEDTLKKKYGGDENYNKVRKAMLEALEGWKGKEEELSKRAFHMYEDFRPNIAPGQKGWGRKGELSLKSIRDTVEG